MNFASKLLTARELAELVAVSPETVLRWTRRGDLPAIRLPGGALRYAPDAVEGWLASRWTSEPSVVSIGAPDAC
jgi:excisionase family DNA binding protein